MRREPARGPNGEAQDEWQEACRRHRGLPIEGTSVYANITRTSIAATWRSRPDSSPRFKVSLSKFKKIISEVQRRGYATTQGEVTDGHGAIAIAFNSPIGQTLVVGVGGPVEHIEAKRDTILAALKRFVARVDTGLAEPEPFRLGGDAKP